MASSSSRDTRHTGVATHGASEHVQSGGTPKVLQAIGFANIGLSREAFRSGRWERTHRPIILRQIRELLSQEAVIAVCLGDSAFLKSKQNGANQNKKQPGAAFGGAASGTAAPRGSVVFVSLLHHTQPAHGDSVVEFSRPQLKIDSNLIQNKFGFQFSINPPQL